MLKIATNTTSPAELQAIERIARQGVPPDAELIYDGGRNKVYTLAVGDKKINIKEFKIPGAINNLIYATVRKSKARRSYAYAQELLRLGINTPEPLAYIEERKGPTLHRSYYISRQIEHATEVRYWETKPDSDVMLRALAHDMAKMHALGVWHKDFSPGNVLYTRDAQGKYTFYYVDLNRMQMGVHSRKKQMRNFRCINLDPAQTARLARHYAAATGQDPQAVEAEALAQLDAYMKQRQRKQALKSLLKHNKAK